MRIVNSFLVLCFSGVQNYICNYTENETQKRVLLIAAKDGYFMIKGSIIKTESVVCEQSLF